MPNVGDLILQHTLNHIWHTQFDICPLLPAKIPFQNKSNDLGWKSASQGSAVGSEELLAPLMR